METKKIETLVVYIAQSLVQEPEEISIRTYKRDTETILELKVAPNDISLIIGKKGNVVKSLHYLLTYFSGHHDQSYRLEIADAL